MRGHAEGIVRLGGAGITSGNTVVLRFADGKLETFRLERHPIRRAELSVASPLGRAVLGHHVGDWVQYGAAGQVVTLQIVAVR